MIGSMKNNEPKSVLLKYEPTGGEGECKSTKILTRNKFTSLPYALKLSRAVFKTPRAIFGPLAAT